MTSDNMLSDKEMDANLEKIFLKTGKNKAPENFTENLMSRIDLENQAVTTKYKPLISKWGWTLISVFVLATFYVVFTSGSDSPEKGFEISQLFKNTFSFHVDTQGLLQVSSQITQLLLSSKVFLSLMALVMIGIIQTFIYQKVEILRQKQIMHT